MELPDYKILFGILIVIVLVLIYTLWKKKRERVANREIKRGKKSKKPKKRSKPQMTQDSETFESEEEEDDQELDSSDDSSDDTATELYGLVHDRMAANMKSDEFIDVVGDKADHLTFIELKQLYNNARNNRQDPSTAVSVDHYASILKKREVSLAG